MALRRAGPARVGRPHPEGRPSEGAGGGGRLSRVVAGVERAVKGPLFDCRMCGQCVLIETAYVCPMRCPKRLRSGPCGGSLDGRCEVDRDTPCVWAVIHQRAQALGRVQRLREFRPPALDWRLWGTSSWLNALSGRDRLHRRRRTRRARRPVGRELVPCPCRSAGRSFASRRAARVRREAGGGRQLVEQEFVFCPCQGRNVP